MDWELVFLITASVVSMVWWIPQVVRVSRYGTSGVSVETWTFAVVNLFLWGWWALVAGQLTVAVVEWIQAAGSAVVVAKVGVARRAIGLACVVALIMLSTQVWEVTASVAAVASVAVVRVPQLVVVLRNRSDKMIMQVSGLTWLMAGLSNLLWLGWGFAGGHTTMIVGAGLSVVLSLSIAAAVRVRDDSHLSVGGREL